MPSIPPDPTPALHADGAQPYEARAISPPMPLGAAGHAWPGAAPARAHHPPAAGVEADAPDLSGAALAALDDAALVERAKRDPEAFGALYERHVQSVFAFAFSRVRDRSQAEDITAQTFLQALRALPRYQQRGAPIRSWFFRIAANLIADAHRAPATVQPAEVWQHGQALAASGRADGDGYPGADAAAFDPPDPRAEAEIAAWEAAEDFVALLTDLTPDQRTVLQLRFGDTLSIAEIARRVDRSEGAVKMLLMRGLQQLRRRWGREAADD